MSEDRHGLHLEKILFPTDLSDGSLAVYPYAADLARLKGGKITVLYLADLIDAGIDQPLPLTSTKVLERAVQRGAEQRLKEIEGVFKREEGVDYELEAVAAEGIPETISAVAKQGSYDLVVMGTHGRTGFTRLLCGSIAEETVRTAPCPVLLVRIA